MINPPPSAPAAVLQTGAVSVIILIIFLIIPPHFLPPPLAMCPARGAALSPSEWRGRSAGTCPSSSARLCPSRTVSPSPTSPASTPASPAARSPGREQYLEKYPKLPVIPNYQWQSVSLRILTRQYLGKSAGTSVTTSSGARWVPSQPQDSHK